MSDHTPYHVGEGDLLFLGMAAAFAARFQARRNGARNASDVFPHSDKDAVDLLILGINDGTRMPLDDVPEVEITVSMDSEDLHWMLAACHPREFPDEDIQNEGPLGPG